MSRIVSSFMTIIVSVLMSVLLLPTSTLAKEATVSSNEELINALVDQSEEITVTLAADIEINMPININGKVVIKGDGYKLTYTNAYADKMFNVSASGDLTLSNVVVDGGNAWSWINSNNKLNPDKHVTNNNIINMPGNILTGNVIDVKGSLTLNNGTKLQNFVTSNTINDQKYDKQFIIFAEGNSEKKANVVLDNVVISNNIGVVLKTTESNVEIKGNTSVIDNYGFGKNGGLFNLQDNTIAVLTNAIIKDNVSAAVSGSIFGLSENSYLVMNGGTISNNLSKNWGTDSLGAMIVVESGSGFEMNGGAITNNSGTLVSAIASRFTNGYNDYEDRGIYLNKGTISGNTTTVDTLNDATIFARSNVSISENMTIEGTVVANSQNANVTNNGTIKGNFIVNDSSAVGTNNGVIDGDALLVDGKLINNGTIKNAYEGILKIENNGVIEEEYVKTLPLQDGKVIITLKGNGGREVIDTYTSLDIYLDVNTVLALENIPVFAKSGHTFTKWYLDETLTTEFDFSQTITENIVLYADYEINVHTLTFIIDGKIYEYQLTFGEEVIIPEELLNPTKDGYHFHGWIGYTEGMTMPDEDLTITAEFEEHNFTDWEVIEESTENKNGTEVGTCGCGAKKYRSISKLVVDKKEETTTESIKKEPAKNNNKKPQKENTDKKEEKPVEEDVIEKVPESKDDEKQNGCPWWCWVIILLVIINILLVIFLLKKKKKEKDEQTLNIVDHPKKMKVLVEKSNEITEEDIKAVEEAVKRKTKSSTTKTKVKSTTSSKTKKTTSKTTTKKTARKVNTNNKKGQ